MAPDTDSSMLASRGSTLRLQAVTALLACTLVCGAAFANPGGPQVVSGQVSFGGAGNQLLITNSPGAIINWQSFSIASGELTRFIQQGPNSSVLNRITGQDPSLILGALQSNGKVFLINPNGILFGQGAQVNVGGLVVSSLNISNTDFIAGKLNFSGSGSAGSVSNQGAITTPSGGQVMLIAPNVTNSGIITAPGGEVLLAAGQSVNLTDSTDPDMQVVISASSNRALNLGQVVAQSGKIGIYGALVNQLGLVSANSAVAGENGKIVLKASGTTTLGEGSVTSATGAGTGGEIQVLGNDVGLTGNAVIDASGQGGGGTILIGGSLHGADPTIQNATAAYVGAGTSIRADAGQSGNGGTVVVWSHDATRAYGSISAQGGTAGGNGGFVETSGHYLDVNGITVSAGAPKGNPGTWLLDPYDITIGTGTDTSTNSGTNPITYQGTTSGSLLLASTVTTALNGGTSVIVDTSGAGGDAGSITVSSPINVAPSGVPTLTLKANQDINVNATIQSSGDPLWVTLTADQLGGGTGGVYVNAAITTNNGNLVINGGNTVTVSSSGSLNTGNLIGSAGGAPVSIVLPNPSSTINIANNGSNNQINASAVTLSANTINLNGNITANAGPIQLTAGSGGINNSGNGLLTGNTLEVNSAGSVAIDGGNSFNTLAANVTGGGSVDIQVASPALTVGSVGSTTGATASGGVYLANTAGDIALNAAVNAGSSPVLLNAAGGVIQGGGLITGGRLNVISGNATGIGSSGTPLLTNVATLQSADSSGPVYINNSGNLTVLSVSATGAVNVNSGGSLTVPTMISCDCSSAVNGSSVTLTALGNMLIDSTASVTATGAANLYAGYNAGTSTYVAAPNALTINGSVSGANVNLFAGGAINLAGTTTGALTQAPNQIGGVAPPPPPPPPTLAQCIAQPALPGCSSVLPTLAQCIALPSVPGCIAVLPALSVCVVAPTVAGCSAVLPTLAQCTAAPTTAGCSAVLPTVAQCTVTPTAAGCSVVLPTLAQCTAAPTAAGCSAVLPTFAQCTAAPATAGCSAVLPSVAQCTAAPTLAGCNVVLPTLAQCTATPTAAGCGAVLPTFGQCTAAPAIAGCSAVLPSVAQCTAAPTLAGCNVVLPTIAQCATTPALSGCSAVLPTPAQCVANSALTGCNTVLAQCNSSPTAAGCSGLTPTPSECTSFPSLAGCAAAPVVSQATPTILASNSYIIALNTQTVGLLNGGSQGGAAGSNSSGTSSTGSSSTSTTNTGATNNGSAKKLYCN